MGIDADGCCLACGDPPEHVRCFEPRCRTSARAADAERIEHEMRKAGATDQTFAFLAKLLGKQESL